jgi:hypothetical protein
LNPIIILGGIFFLYLLATKPNIIALVFFTMTIASLNAEIGGLPMNIRALIGAALFMRTVVDRSNKDNPAFIANPAGLLIFVFIIYSFIITLFFNLFTAEVIKQSGLALISAYTAYYYYFEFRRKNFDFLKVCLIAGGLVCFADLAYTYAAFGTFPVQRVHHFLLKIPPIEDELDPGGINHNYFGQICGMCFIYLFSEFLNGQLKNKLTIILFPLMFLGVLMSTSRSALLAIFVICFFLMAKGLKNSEKAKKVYAISMFGIGGIFLAIFLFFTLQSFLDIDSDFIENITSRLITEPVAVMNKHLGLRYNASDLGPMDWREEASKEAYNAFLNLKFNEQVTGIGYGGYVYRNLGRGYQPHNGILLILIEAGITGLVLYLTIVGSIIRKSLKSKTISPLVTILLFFFFYCIGQNGELTSGIAFLFIGSLIAENKYNELYENEPEHDIATEASEVRPSFE